MPPPRPAAWPNRMRKGPLALSATAPRSSSKASVPTVAGNLLPLGSRKCAAKTPRSPASPGRGRSPGPSCRGRPRRAGACRPLWWRPGRPARASRGQQAACRLLAWAVMNWQPAGVVARSGGERDGQPARRALRGRGVRHHLDGDAGIAGGGDLPPARPNTIGSPPFRRTTRAAPASASETISALMSSCLQDGCAGRSC